MKTREWLVYGLSIVTMAVLVGYFADVVAPPAVGSGRTLDPGFLLVSLLAIVGNVRIIQYHATVPPHPKFLLVPERRFWIRVHALTGSVEVVLGVVAWLLEDRALALATAGVALIGHVPSSFVQTPGVFGSKGVMVPAYLGVVTLHAYCAVRLVMEGGDIVWLERTWMALQAYAYVRIFGSLIQQTGAFRDSIYTASVVLAGTAITPFILGPAGPVCVLLVVLIHLGWTRLILRPSTAEWHGLFEEHARRTLIDPGLRTLWMARHVQDPGSAPVIEHARLAFTHLDRNASGRLSQSEVQTLMREWGAPEHFAEAFIRHYGSREGIDFETFVSTLWLSGRFHEPVAPGIAQGVQTPEQQARLVFDHLDLNGNGQIDLFELELLLLEWGMTTEEARYYVERFGGTDRVISFTEFFTHMRPIWRFGFREVFH